MIYILVLYGSVNPNTVYAFFLAEHFSNFRHAFFQKGLFFVPKPSFWVIFDDYAYSEKHQLDGEQAIGNSQ